MPYFEREEAGSRGGRLYYEEHGSGFPVLLFAPGGMRSAVPLWERAPFDPTSVLADEFRLIAMDQRNAGRSTAPVSGEDGWQTYADDHLALLDHLGIERCHLLGMCIGGSFCLKLIETAPDRVAAAALLQPIGFDDNRDDFRAMFDGWAEELRTERDDVTPEALAGLRSNLFDQDFVFSVSRDFVRRCTTPMLVFQGNDNFHPAATSREVAELAPEAELIESWKADEAVDAAVARIRSCFREHARGAR